MRLLSCELEAAETETGSESDEELSAFMASCCEAEESLPQPERRTTGASSAPVVAAHLRSRSTDMAGKLKLENYF